MVAGSTGVGVGCGVGVGPVGTGVGVGPVVGEADGVGVTVFTCTDSFALCFFLSRKAIVHEPLPTGVTVTISFGPLPESGNAFATPLHVPCSTNFPLYAFSETTIFLANF